ncbi:MAG: threonyl-tRNA synthetase editing domain-containing protein [Candidatus Micrarchaeia archaeon]
MRLMAWHIEYLNAVPKEKGRSKFAEQAQSIKAAESLLCFISYEKNDEKEGVENITNKAYLEIKKIADNLGIKNIILNPFAHMFADLSDEKFAYDAILSLEKKLAADFTINRFAFGWFYEIELKAKGHKFARISRII